MQQKQYLTHRLLIFASSFVKRLMNKLMNKDTAMFLGFLFFK